MTETKLIMAGEAGKLLGTSRQRVYQLAKTDPDFPAAEVKTAAGNLYDPKKIKAYGKKHANKPIGRPRKPAPA